jgi:hypothetical protein
MCNRAASYTLCMPEPHSELHPHAEPKLGMGIDRTTIQRLLVLTPAERIRLAVREANNLARLMEKMQIR